MDVSRISYELRKHFSVLIISTIEPLELAPGSSGIHPGLGCGKTPFSRPFMSGLQGNTLVHLRECILVRKGRQNNYKTFLCVCTKITQKKDTNKQIKGSNNTSTQAVIMLFSGRMRLFC